MTGPIVHFCYCGTSGSTSVAINIARGSATPRRHAYVFYGVDGVREDYVSALSAMGCQWRHVGKRKGIDVACYLRCAGAILELSPVAAVFHGWRSLPIALCLRLASWRVPIVSVQHGPLPLPPLPSALFSWMGDCTVAVSTAILRRIEDSGALSIACSPLKLIENGLDERFWTAGEAGGAVPLVVGMIATLSPSKDHATLIRSIRVLADRGMPVRLELAGGGVLAGELKDLAEGLGVGESVRFLGDLSPEAVRAALHRWSVLVHSTHGEGLSMAVLEGLATGRPLVASDAPGMREVIEHGRSGLLFKAGDPAALADAIARLAADPEYSRRIGIAGRALVLQRFTAQRMAREYESLVDELLDL